MHTYREISSNKIAPIGEIADVLIVADLKNNSSRP